MVGSVYSMAVIPFRRPLEYVEPVARIPRRTMMAAIEAGLDLELFWVDGEIQARYAEPERVDFERVGKSSGA